MPKFEAYWISKSQQTPVKQDIPTKSGAPPTLLSAFTKLLTDPTIPAIDLAHEAVNPLPREHAYAPEPKPPITEILYAMLIDAVKNLTEMNNRLVDFTEALEGSPGGEYKNLDGLAMEIDEFSWGLHDGGGARQQNRQTWFNLNAYTAKLAAVGLPDSWAIYRGGRVLQKALERNWQQWDMGSLDGYMPAAAIWIRHCGSRIYQERWEYWKKRFEWVTTVKTLKESTRDEARQCVEQMGDIEQRF
ncbi:DUF3632 domain-containing protein [Aspergillus glaucus CBS 516.65]|uniref:Uncharacterized protein n=1 Tax=Aspergillus glaucus CBS 516.65 TaxID=1160497 RepID=A0A1L9VDX3_ASPGL|nr:hypothetical protein ASPGLDRAFT_59671 [Aspergillus glaucus CBS 516.65]OJJ82137.1 hypothetical protein ASPGLDRAFT_59671 [Aspergillus glaucus CBS 516.65]